MDDPAADDEDLRDYLREIANTPLAPRPPIAVSETALPPLTQFFSDPPASTQLPPVPDTTTVVGGGIANPVGDGFYGRKMTSGVGTWEKNIAPVIPEIDGTYVFVVSSMVGAWAPRDLPPDVPAAIPGEDCYYVLRRNSSADPVWFKMFIADIPDCPSGTYGVFSPTDPGP